MPELPEVETVKRGLEALITPGTEDVLKVELSEFKLRTSPPKKTLAKVKKQRLLKIRRRAKYLLFELSDWVMLSHLGMTGSWRIESNQKKHDHIRIFLSSGRILTYNDPRRFGMFDLIPKKQIKSDIRFVNLGMDPVEDTKFSGKNLYPEFQKSSVAVKSFIMNQKNMVGVGNIYASEALFLAGIHPLTSANKLSKSQVKILCESIYEVLIDAIDCGGTTISDFKQAGGSEGYFQNLLLVYGRDKEACVFCETMIQSQVIAQRNSFWCPHCQAL